MKNNKKLKNNEQLILAAGVFKKRMWPWLFVILAAVIAAACYALIAVEYFFGTKVCETCTSYFTYTRHYYQFVNLTLIVVAALIVIAILCAIIFLRKRTLTVSTTQITYKKGRKTIEIPLSTIHSIDTASSCVIVNVPFKKFKFKQLKNKKEIYDALLEQLVAPVIHAKEAVITTPITLTAPAAANTASAKPSLSETKVRYFQSLLNAGVITPAQFDSYVIKVFSADFPTFAEKQ